MSHLHVLSRREKSNFKVISDLRLPYDRTFLEYIYTFEYLRVSLILTVFCVLHLVILCKCSILQFVINMLFFTEICRCRWTPTKSRFLIVPVHQNPLPNMLRFAHLCTLVTIRSRSRVLTLTHK